MFAGALQCVCILIIADYTYDLRIRDRSVFHTVNDRLQVRSASGHHHQYL